ncbi:MAG: hypothetical protein H5U02_01845 [Clostridia bacterium]|nr:hypothetical protein [Clostridia bacterium]
MNPSAREIIESYERAAESLLTDPAIRPILWDQLRNPLDWDASPKECLEVAMGAGLKSEIAVLGYLFIQRLRGLSRKELERLLLVEGRRKDG